MFDTMIVAATVAPPTPVPPASVATSSGPPCPADRVSAAAADTVRFLDMHFQRASLPHVITAIKERPPAERFSYVVTPNVDHVVRLQRQRSDLWPAYRHAGMTLCDSRILGRLAQRVGIRLPIMPGSDLTMTMFREVIARDDRIAVVGGTDEAIASLRARFGLENVTHYNPPMGFIDLPHEVRRAADFIVASKARYSFIALGSPQQEVLAYRVAMLGTAIGLGFCIGASLDFLTGRQRRAPRFLQRLSLEWLFRLATHPVRLWRRYLVDGPAIFDIYRHWRARYG